MKRIRVLSSSAILTLKNQIPRNVELYKSGSREWLDEFFADKRNSILSVIEDTGVNLKVDKLHSIEYDAENAKLLFEGYPGITPAIAADGRVWTTLCHNQHYEYMLKRWPIVPGAANQTEEGIIEQRYFFYRGPRKSQERNGLSRLWLSAALTYDSGRQDPYELTKILLQNSNFTWDLLGRTFGSNRKIVQGTMDAVLRLQNERGEIITSKPIKSFTKKLNLVSGVTMLDRYSENEICQMAKKHISDFIDMS